MKLDRDLQRKILEGLRDEYPLPDHRKLFAGIQDGSDEDQRVVANLVYLEEHGLIHSGITFSLSNAPMYSGARITAAGMDFLADDGGLTAILGTVTVKLHADTIRELMLAKVDSSSLPAPEKSKIKKAISALSNEALKEVTKKLVAAGLENIPDAVGFVRQVTGL